MERKKLSELNLTNRFLFDQTMENKEAYEALVSILLEEDVRFPARTQTEKELRISPELREARLDVFAVDESEKMYYTEMQGSNTGNLIRRSRFYQAQMDVSLLEPGETNFNRLNDGALRIFINTQGTNDEDFSEEFLELMKYIECTNDEIGASLTGKRAKVIYKYVTKVKLSEKMGAKYMQWWEELELAREQGIERGIETGELRLLVKQIIAKLNKNQSPIAIADALEEDAEYIQKVCNAVIEFAPEYDLEKILDNVREL